PVVTCCDRWSLSSRLASWQAALVRSDTPFSVSPELCRRFRRSHGSRCLCLFLFLGSASARLSLPFFFMVCSRSCATRQAACRTFRGPCANLQSHWDVDRRRGSGKFTFRWHRVRSYLDS